MIGTLIGHYRVEEKIGAGGMGEVYRARDLTLERDVALKVLPDAVAGTPERLARFEREARLLAALNHQNIAAIYGVQDAGATRALVLELVEGPTLAEMLMAFAARGLPMPIDEVVTVARQIAQALDAAHGKGIIHRDLKPSNVKVRRDGVVKVLDFGLGRAGVSSSLDVPEANVTTDATLPGVVLGTAAYMSPEQARGGPLDRRADIWAFGCVLFEMLTGTMAFGAATISDTFARVLGSEPDWARLPEETPVALRHLLGRCLQKDVSRRLRDIGDAEFELPAGERPDSAPMRVTEVRLERLTDSIGMAGAPTVSPDGKMVAYVAVTGGRRQIWIRLLAGGTPLQVTRDDADHEEPRWLRDSSSLAYYVPAPTSGDGALWQISALGGPARRIAPAVCGGDVSHDGRRVACFQRRSNGVALVVLALDRGTSETIAEFPPDHQYMAPRWSPDDRLVSFQRAGLLLEASLEVVRLADRRQRTIVQTTWLRGHSWLPDGSGIVYSGSRGSTMAYPPTNNLRLVRPDGQGDRQLTFGDIAYQDPHVDGSGRIVATRLRGRSDVWRFPIDGRPAENVRDGVPVTRQTGRVQVPAVSPDGRQMVYVSDLGGHSNLWLTSLDGGVTRQLTFETDPDVAIGVPCWSPDGTRLVFVAVRNGRIDVLMTGADGSGVVSLVHEGFSPSWAPDGRTLYCNTTLGQIGKVDVDTGALVPVRSGLAYAPVAMPGGKGIYFSEMPEHPFGTTGDSALCRAVPDDGPAEVLVRLPLSRIPLAPRLHLHASLSPDGRWLAAPLLDSTTANIWAVPTDGGPMRALTDFGDRSVFIARSVSWSPDSRHVYAAVEDVNTDITLLRGLLG